MLLAVFIFGRFFRGLSEAFDLTLKLKRENELMVIYIARKTGDRKVTK